MLVASEFSLEDLNERMEVPVDMNRFRRNIVVRGLEAWAEDDVNEYSTGGITMHAQAHCERCAVTSTDQLTGERTGQPLRTLKSFRLDDEGYSSGIRFGEYLSVKCEGTLAVGDILALS